MVGPWGGTGRSFRSVIRHRAAVLSNRGGSSLSRVLTLAHTAFNVDREEVKDFTRRKEGIMIITPPPGASTKPNCVAQIKRYKREKKLVTAWESSLDAAANDDNVELTVKPVVFINELLTAASHYLDRLLAAKMTGTAAGGYRLTRMEMHGWVLAYVAIGKQLPLEVLQARKAKGGTIRYRAVKDQERLSVEVLEAIKTDPRGAEYKEGINLYLLPHTVIRGSKTLMGAAGLLGEFFQDRTSIIPVPVVEAVAEPVAEPVVRSVVEHLSWKDYDKTRKEES